jgi:Sugar efflux transporter for intercellular exchange
MPAGNDILLPLSIVGTILSIALSLSQLPRIRNVITNKDASYASPLPNFLLLLNSALWCGCAVHIQKRWDLFAVNGIGAAFTTTFAVIMIIFTREKLKKLLHITAIITAYLFTIFLFLILFTFPSRNTIPYERAAVLANTITVIVNTTMFAGPLLSVVKAVRTKDISGVPILLTVVAFFCAVVWCAFGLCLGPDWFVTSPNLIGALLSAAQLAAIASISWGNRLRKRKLDKAVLLASNHEASPVTATDGGILSPEGVAVSVDGKAVDKGGAKTKMSIGGSSGLVGLPPVKLSRGGSSLGAAATSHHNVKSSSDSAGSGTSAHSTVASSVRLRRKSSLSGGDGSSIGIVVPDKADARERTVSELSGVRGLPSSPSTSAITVDVGSSEENLHSNAEVARGDNLGGNDELRGGGIGRELPSMATIPFTLSPSTPATPGGPQSGADQQHADTIGSLSRHQQGISMTMTMMEQHLTRSAGITGAIGAATGSLQPGPASSGKVLTPLTTSASRKGPNQQGSESPAPPTVLLSSHNHSGNNGNEEQHQQGITSVPSNRSFYKVDGAAPAADDPNWPSSNPGSTDRN